MLSAMGHGDSLGAIRVSLEPTATPDQVDAFLDVFRKIIERRAKKA